MKYGWSRTIFWFTIVNGILRDTFMSDTNTEVWLGFIAGMTTAVAVRILFETKRV